MTDGWLQTNVQNIRYSSTNYLCICSARAKTLVNILRKIDPCPERSHGVSCLEGLERGVGRRKGGFRLARGDGA